MLTLKNKKNQFERGYWYRWGAFLLFWGTVFGVPLALLPLSSVFFSGIITPDEGICIMVEREVGLSIFFVIANFFLSMGMLSLFYVPLYNNAKILMDQNPGIGKQLLQIGTLNAQLTGCALVVTTVAVIFLMVAEARENSDTSFNYWMIIAVMVLCTDLCFNALMAKLMWHRTKLGPPPPAPAELRSRPEAPESS